MAEQFASCCLLSYNRAEFVEEAILTLTGNAHFPLELIVHDDGSTDPDVIDVLRRFVDAGAISTLIENPKGHNQGVGNAIDRMFAIAQGDPIIKLDQDLIFMPGWLETVVGVLELNKLEASVNGTPTIGALGMFKYYAEPVNYPDTVIAGHEGWTEVEDFVGSAFAVPRDVFSSVGSTFPTHSDAFAEDVEFKKDLQRLGYSLGLTTDDLVTNRGFGLGPSTVAIPGMDGEPTTAPIKHGPHVLTVTK